MLSTRSALKYSLGESDSGSGSSTIALRAVGEPDVDLGQALRGHRYAYRVVGGERRAPYADVPRWGPADVLAVAEGLVDFAPGTHLIDGVEDGHTALALLGRVLPHNTVLWDGLDWTRAAAAGKAGPPRVVVHVG